MSIEINSILSIIYFSTVKIVCRTFVTLAAPQMRIASSPPHQLKFYLLPSIIFASAALPAIADTGVSFRCGVMGAATAMVYLDSSTTHVAVELNGKQIITDATAINGQFRTTLGPWKVTFTPEWKAGRGELMLIGSSPNESVILRCSGP